MKKNFCPYCMSVVEEGVPCATCGLTAGTYTPSPHHLPLGTVLMDRYMVGRVLGEGGFGITYIGCDLRLELKVAIKEYFPTDKVTRLARESLDVSSYVGAASVGYEEGKVRFLNEARTMARMDKQPEIVSVRDFFECNNTAYIVMEFINGTTFKDIVAQKGGRIPPQELFSTMEPLFSALTSMHQLGLIHRDISPDNLMLERGALRLLDFGCARESSRGTETMTITLKHGFAPIEQYQHKGQGPWTDVYALAATMYYCLTGKIPPQSLDRLCEDELILPRKLGIDITERQEQALLYGMGIRPRRRFQSVEEFHAALYVPNGPPIPAVEEEPLMPAALQQHTTVSPTVQDAVSKTEPAIPVVVFPPREISKTVPAELVEELPAEEISKTAPTEAAVETPAEKIGKTMPTEEEAAEPVQQDEAPETVAHSAAVEETPVTEEVAEGLMEEPAAEAIPASAAVETAADSEAGGSNPLKKNRLAVIAAVVVVAVFGLFLLLRPGTSDGTGEEMTEDLFAKATTLTVGGEEEFRAMLADESVSAIILDTYVHLSGEEVTINKPVRINAGYDLNTMVPITIAEGGYLHCEGGFYFDALVRSTGGTIHVAPTGRMDGWGYLWLASAENLVVDDGGSAVISGEEWTDETTTVHLTADEDAIFADALHVNTLDELLAANDNNEVSAIVVDADIRLTEWFACVKPVLISEGVTVESPALEGHEFGNMPGWGVGSTICVNHGTLRGALNVGNWNNGGAAILNYGLVEASLHFDTPGCFINYGELVSSDAHIPQGNFINMGLIQHNGSMQSNVDHRYMDVADGFINHGEIRIYDENAHLLLAGERTALNSGTIIAENGGMLMVQNYLVNSGEINAQLLDGSGIIEQITSHASLRAEDMPYGGLLTHNMAGNVERPEDSPVVQVAFDWQNGGEKWDSMVRWVHNEHELWAALNETICEVVIVEGDLEISGNLEIHKGFACTDRFTVHGSVTVGEGGYFISGETHVEGDVTVENGGVWLNRNGLSCGELRLNDGYFFNQAHFEEVAEITVNGGRLSNIGNIDMSEKQISVERGEFITLGRLWLHGCEITVGEEASFSNSQGNFSIDGDTTIENRGYVGLHHWEWQEHTFHVNMVNYGYMDLTDQMELRGHVENHGEIHVHGFVPVNGTIANHGEIVVEDGNIYAVDGEITGNAIIKR